MITLTQLCDHLGRELEVARATRLGHTELTGVHISELADPTPYLEGGELLLTTGIPLAGGPESVGSYVARLVARGVAALGLGLGAGTNIVPIELREACETAGLHLLIVPDGIPFLHISRAYWDLVGRAEQADLSAGLKKQTSLARAATRPGAVGAVIRMLAESSGGWAAFLPSNGRTETVWPLSQRSVLPQLREETDRLNLAGTYSSATFPLAGTDVVVHSIVVERSTVGFLAVGTGRALRRADRQLLLTGCMLLAVTAQQERQLAKADSRGTSTVASLIVHGYSDAARLAVSELGLTPLPTRLTLLAVRGRDLATLDVTRLADVLNGLLGSREMGALFERVRGATLRCEVDGLTVVLLDSDADSSREAGVIVQSTQEDRRDGVTAGFAATAGLDATIRVDATTAPARTGENRTGENRAGGNRPGSTRDWAARNGVSQRPARTAEIAAVLSHTVRLEQVAGIWSELKQRCQRAAPGRLEVGVADRRPEAEDWVAALREHPRGDLVETVRSYLRHRGQWEATARELGLHRNSLRHRVALASGLLGVDLDDPDVASHLWLALQGAVRPL